MRMFPISRYNRVMLLSEKISQPLINEVKFKDLPHLRSELTRQQRTQLGDRHRPSRLDHPDQLRFPKEALRLHLQFNHQTDRSPK